MKEKISQTSEKIALESLKLSQEWILDGSKYRVVNAGNQLNSKANDFSPFFSMSPLKIMPTCKKFSEAPW